MRRRVAVCALVVAWLAWSSHGHAGAYLQSEGDAVGATGVSYSLSESFWTRDGGLTSYPAQHQQAVAYVYYAYGYSYYYTLFASTAWIYNDRGAGTTHGVDDVKIGVTGRLNPFRNGRAWQVTAIVPVKEFGSSGDRPGQGTYGLDVGVFYRFLPDPYEIQFTDYAQSIWGGGLGTTVRSGNAGSELWAYGAWEKQVLNPSWHLGITVSAITSYAGRASGGVDVHGPNDSYHYDQVTSEGSLHYRLTRATSINLSYKRDVWGRNSNKNEGLHLGLSMTWRK